MSLEFKPSIEKEYVPEIMTWEEYGESDHSQPYVFELKKGETELTYFGALHSNDPTNPMFTEIKAKFEAARPDSVFVEGIEHLEEIKNDPERLAKAIHAMKSLSEEDVIRKYGEPGLGLKLAVEADIPFFSPEPKFFNEIADLLAGGFTKEEIFAEYAHRQLYQYYRNKEDMPVKEYLQRAIIDGLEASTQWKDFDYSIENLEKISFSIWGEKGDIHKPDFSSERTNPVPEAIEFKTRITAAGQRSSHFRDVYIVKKIQEAIQTYKRPFVIFGAGHAYMQRPALEKLFSKEQ